MSQDRSPTHFHSEYGVPDEIIESQLPIDSGWGLQDGFVHKIQGGESVLKWMYYGDPKDRCIWFAKVNGCWVFTLQLSAPKGLLRECEVQRQSGPREV